MVCTPQPEKSRTLRVASPRGCSMAVEAISLSGALRMIACAGRRPRHSPGPHLVGSANGLMMPQSLDKNLPEDSITMLSGLPWRVVWKDILVL